MLEASRRFAPCGAVDGDRDLRCACLLDGADVEALASAFGVAFNSGGRDAAPALFRAEGVRAAPCLARTGYGPALVLEGREPLAMFRYADQRGWLDESTSRFDPLVAEGRFVRCEVAFPAPKS